LFDFYGTLPTQTPNHNKNCILRHSKIVLPGCTIVVAGALRIEDICAAVAQSEQAMTPEQRRVLLMHGHNPSIHPSLQKIFPVFVLH